MRYVWNNLYAFFCCLEGLRFVVPGDDVTGWLGRRAGSRDIGQEWSDILGRYAISGPSYASGCVFAGPDPARDARGDGAGWVEGCDP
jgi:hypothetical protein